MEGRLMKKYIISQKLTLEYGKFSALPEHKATRTIAVDHVYESSEVKYSVRGGGFMTMDPLTNAPPTEDRQEFGERCYVSFGEFTVLREFDDGADA